MPEPGVHGQPTLLPGRSRKDLLHTLKDDQGLHFGMGELLHGKDGRRPSKKLGQVLMIYGQNLCQHNQSVQCHPGTGKTLTRNKYIEFFTKFETLMVKACYIEVHHSMV